MSDDCLKMLVAPTDNITPNNRSNDGDITIITNDMTDKLSSKLKPNMASKKKLTQALLSFKPLDVKSSKPVPAACSKKRKLSDQDGSALNKLTKFQKTNVENKTKPHSNLTNTNTSTTTTTTNNNNINNNTNNSSGFGGGGGGGGSGSSSSGGNINNNKANNSSSITEMEVCDEVISSSGSSSVATPMQQIVKSHTLDKFFSPRNVQDEIISSSTNGFIDLTKSDGEENPDKENKLRNSFNEDANFTLFSDSQEKVKESSRVTKSSISDKILKEKFDQAVKSEVKIVLPDLALCDMSICSSPIDNKLITSALSNSPLSCSKALILSTSVEQKDDSSSELDLSTCATPGNELSSSSSSVHSNSDEEEKESTAAEMNQTSTPLASTPKNTQVKQKRRRTDPLRQKIKEERENERLKRKEEKENERLQKLQQRKEEKERRSHERNQLKLQKDKERIEKEKQRDKERLEKEKQKDDLRRKKQDIIDAKQEEKRKKDEEKKMKEEEKVKEKEEELRKQQRTKAAFQNYFVQKPKSKPVGKPKEHSGMFMPFEVKKDMRMAPGERWSLSKECLDKLDEIMTRQDHQCLYHAELKKRCFKPRKSGKTWPRKGEQSDDDICFDDVVKVTYHVKLLQFHTNYRPPYYGTWRKSSNVLSAKYPWKKDTALFDYDVDSDDEWEEEEPGESLSSSEEEEEKDEKDDDEDEEDGWMVPHGYLSEGEGCVEDDEQVTPEILKARQAAKAETWERQRNQQGLPHKPEYIGCIWDGSVKDNVIADIFNEYKVTVINGEIPVTTSHNRAPKDVETNESKSGNNFKKRIVPEEAHPDLIRFVHGSRTGIKKLVVEFHSYWNMKQTANLVAKTAQEETKMEAGNDSTPTTPASKTEPSKQMSPTPNTSINEPDAPEENSMISKRQLEKRIMTIAMREKRSEYSKICWYVHKDILKQYGLEDLPLKDKAAELKAQEELLAAIALSTSSVKNSQQMLPTTLEAKTPNKSNTNEKPSSRPAPSDQMSILSFAQASDKLNSVRTVSVADCVTSSSISNNNNNNSGDNVTMNDAKDIKSPAKKLLPRDQMSILNFTKAAPLNPEKTAPQSRVKTTPQNSEKSVSLKQADSSCVIVLNENSADSTGFEMKASSDCKSMEKKARSDCKTSEIDARDDCDSNSEVKPRSSCDSNIMKPSVISDNSDDVTPSIPCKGNNMKPSNGCDSNKVTPNLGCDSNEVTANVSCDSNEVTANVSCDSNDVTPSSTCEGKERKAECIAGKAVEGKKDTDDKMSPDSEISAKPQIETHPPTSISSSCPQDCSSTDVEMVEETKKH